MNYPCKDETLTRQMVKHRDSLVQNPLSRLSDENAKSDAPFHIKVAGLWLDYSRHYITRETLALFQKWAESAALNLWIERLFRGDPINVTENRPAWHVALRGGEDPPVSAELSGAKDDIRAVREKMSQLCHLLRKGKKRGATGQPITNVVNLGIGGSDLGPRMIVRALEPYADSSINVQFVSNVDGAEITRILGCLDPANTLFIIASKSFTTLETMTNAASARAWLLDAGLPGKHLGKHFVAVTSKPDKARAYGMDDEHIFPMWDWVGGRYSLWSAIGLPIAIAIGMDRFNELLDGARIMDRHFRTEPIERNMPMLMGMLGAWYINFFSWTTHAVLPYDDRLKLLCPFLQQLDMESNGKSTLREGGEALWHTGPLLWGEVGTNGQHSFFQWLHQGKSIVPADFIACIRPNHHLINHHKILLANCFAQAEALMRGRNHEQTHASLLKSGGEKAEADRLAPHQTFPGDRPSSIILLDQLDPASMGALIALHEHKVFVQSVLWQINPFDQWGVELGKTMAQSALDVFEGKDEGVLSPSLQQLITRVASSLDGV